MLAVAHGMVDAHKDIVEHRENGTAEIKAEIGDRIHHCFIGGAHPAKNGGRTGDTDNGQCRTGTKTEGDGGVNGFADSVVVFRTEIPGDHHTGTHGQAVKEADHQKDQ